ncbi:hypothetical protein QQF64_012879 [Cirrhinus molitorella]|uniref:Telomerase RNA component interacting RNase n=1 Tax=Cirrhinus molitorella TaxID=172907 RepID=A0ABR3LPI8_9TELE
MKKSETDRPKAEEAKKRESQSTKRLHEEGDDWKNKERKKPNNSELFEDGVPAVGGGKGAAAIKEQFLTTKEKFHEFLASGRPRQSSEEPDGDSEEPSAGTTQPKKMKLGPTMEN